MANTSSERRLAENEAIFRKLNEQVSSGFSETNKLAREDNQPEFKVAVKSGDASFQFYCECADENCIDRIPMTIAEYRRIHKNRKQFVVKPGHEVLLVESVVREQPDYTVVEKQKTPPEKPETLHPSSVDNN